MAVAMPWAMVCCPMLLTTMDPSNGSVKQRLDERAWHVARRGEVTGLRRTKQEQVVVVGGSGGETAGESVGTSEPSPVSGSVPSSGIPHPLAFIAARVSLCIRVASRRLALAKGRLAS